MVSIMMNKKIFAIGLPHIQHEIVQHKNIDQLDSTSNPDIILISVEKLTGSQCEAISSKTTAKMWGVIDKGLDQTITKKLFSFPPLHRYINKSILQKDLETLGGGSEKKQKELQEKLEKAQAALVEKDKELKALDEALRSLASMTQEQQTSDQDSPRIHELEQLVESKEEALKDRLGTVLNPS